VDYASVVTYTNFAVLTNATTVYGANVTDLPTAILAFNSEHNTTNTYMHPGTLYDYDNNLPGWMDNYLWANQEDDFYSKGVVVGMITNFQTPFFTNFIVAVREATNSYAYISGFLNGTITATKYKETFKNSPALFEQSHKWYTPIASAPGEQNYLITSVCGNFEVLKKDSLVARVVQLGTKFSTASPEGDSGSSLSWSQSSSWGDDSYIGSGTVGEKNSYKANLKGVARSKGSMLTLNGAVDTVITGYVPISNAPPATTTVVNLAAPTTNFVLTVTSTSSGILTTNFSGGVTNVSPTLTSFLVYDYGDISVTNFVYQTNTAPQGIRSVVVNGKIMGQTLVKNAVFGTNYDAAFILGPVVVPVVHTWTTNYFGWPLSANTEFGPPNPPFPADP
jgi:hypothetical protein